MSDDPRSYLVPDYYPDFQCKMGDCRHACCEGWPISLSMTDYFRLLGADCPPDMRDRLDRALRIALHPTPDRYAQLVPRYDGSCAMHMPDGRCAIHAYLGPENLAAVCRLYPRGVRTGTHHECSCANSCEKTLEMFLHREAPLTFRTMELVTGVPESTVRSQYFYDAGRGQDIRLWLISLMQDRRFSLPDRLIRLGHALRTLDEALDARNDALVAALLDGSASFDESAPALPPDDILRPLQTAAQLLHIISEHSQSVYEYGQKANAWFTAGEPVTQYHRACALMEQLLPDWENWFEHMLVNHMFFSQMPFQDRPVPLRDEYVALCAVYELLRCLCLGCAEADPTVEALVDAAAAAFRLVEHTSFDMHATTLMKDAGCDDIETMLPLLRL